MVEYRHSAHAVWDIKYHIVWVTKYRYKVLRAEIAERTREIIRQLCMSRDIAIVQGHVSVDHVHLLVACPPEVSPAKVAQYLKGASSRKLQDTSDVNANRIKVGMIEHQWRNDGVKDV